MTVAGGTHKDCCFNVNEKFTRSFVRQTADEHCNSVGQRIGETRGQLESPCYDLSELSVCVDRMCLCSHPLVVYDGALPPTVRCSW